MSTNSSLRSALSSASLCLLSFWSVSGWGQEYRTLDGTNNNLFDTNLGAMGTTLSRLTAANYADGVSSIDTALPNPREISNAIFSQSVSRPDERGLSEWAWVWGQFIDHDLDHTLTSNGAGTLSIPIPVGDPTFGSLPPGSAINVTRSAFVTGTGVTTPREHENNISAWLDGGMVYGGRANDMPSGTDRSLWLRDPANTAKLRMTANPTFGDLLPMYEHGTSPTMANVNTPGMTTGTTPGDKAYVAGDVRANENTSLLAIQTVYAREHNRIVDVISTANPTLTQNELYDRARKIVGAEIQSITYREYLPAMGVNLNTYGGYDSNVDASIMTEFSTAAFRVAHSQINAMQLRLAADGSTITEGNLSLANAFFNPDTLLQGGLNPLIRGLAVQIQEANDGQMVDALRNQLFQIFIPGVGLVDNATDLAAVDILRSRDMGLGTYNDVRTQLGLAAATGFGDITSDAVLAAALSSLYADVNDLDLFVGLLVEDHLAGASLGETTERLYALQFEALRDGDRFWYENDLGGINSDLLLVADWDGTGEKTAYEWLSELGLTDILELNSDVTNLQSNVFFASPVPEPGSLVLLLCGMSWVHGRRRSKKAA